MFKISCGHWDNGEDQQGDDFEDGHEKTLER